MQGGSMYMPVMCFSLFMSVLPLKGKAAITLYLVLFLPRFAVLFPLFFFLSFQSRQQLSHVLVFLLRECEGSFCHLQPAQQQMMLLNACLRPRLHRSLISDYQTRIS